MIARILLIAVAMIFGAVGLTLSVEAATRGVEDPPATTSPPQSDRLKSRARLAKLQADIELGEMEHQIHKEFLAEKIKVALEPVSEQVALEMKEFQKMREQLKVLGITEEQFKEMFRQVGVIDEKDLTGEVTKEFQEKRKADQTDLSIRKADFLEEAMKLAELRFQLIELTEKYQESK